ncbi:hypothetical protein [Streptantibioticus ferralitis]|uniref:Uncharacterized protein n=1 Tax=Streptantibioticus ferralitis TaxID=236510 RepID=A0ABT5YVK8_9ACTN|nr:hypothetical protein [Streptantibioticus ferralitis]MDF2255642.1 hypothetical protein [Streptantibioticus ferralitis]
MCSFAVRAPPWPRLQRRAVRYCVAEAEAGLVPGEMLAESRYAAASLLPASDHPADALQQARHAAELAPEREDVHDLLDAARTAAARSAAAPR